MIKFDQLLTEDAANETVTAYIKALHDIGIKDDWIKISTDGPEIKVTLFDGMPTIAQSQKWRSRVRKALNKIIAIPEDDRVPIKTGLSGDGFRVYFKK